MESALGWLGDLARAVAQFVPRFIHVRNTHGGVSWTRGTRVREVRAGFHLWWPWWTEIVTYPLVRQTLNLPNQTLTTGDDVSVTVGGVVVYRISNIVTALTKQYDLNETIRDISLAAIRQYVRGATFVDINGDIDTGLKAQTKDKLRGYGIEIMDVMLTDFARTRVVSLVSSGGRPTAFVDSEED